MDTPETKMPYIPPELTVLDVISRTAGGKTFWPNEWNNGNSDLGPS